jgi:hypothetical protein
MSAPTTTVLWMHSPCGLRGTVLQSAKALRDARRVSTRKAARKGVSGLGTKGDFAGGRLTGQLANWLVTILILSTLALVLHPSFAMEERVVGSASFSTKDAIPPEYFGIVIAGVAARQSWPLLPTKSVRIFDSVWWRVEPARDQFDFRLVDQDVDASQEHKVDLDLMLAYSPTWASARPSEPVRGHAPPGSLAEAANIADWENYVRTLAQRYRGRVHTYELWNEPNLSYSGDIPSLVKLCSAAYRVLKQVDPTITVISPSPAPSDAFPFLRQFLTLGGGSTFDVLGFHFYDNLGNPNINPELFLGTTEHIRLLLSQLHLPAKPIWNTESGYYIETSANGHHAVRNFPKGVHALSQDQAAAAVARSFILAWASGVTRFYWYAWAEPQYALVDDMGATDKPATVAFRVIAQWLQGTKYVSLTRSSDGLWVLSSTQRNGHPSWIVWSSSQQDIKFSVSPSMHPTRVFKLDGTETTLESREILATQLPMLLE